MKRFLSILIIVFFIPVILSAGEARIDQPAPAFTLKDSNGKTVKLADFKSKYVVLEWVNYGCPFVQKHYKSGNMQALQTKYREAGVVWLAICSSAPGKQGYFTENDLNKKIREMQGKQSAYLLDPEGRVGRMYDARTTPHMYIINPEGVLIYAGGIDDIRSTDIADIAKARNYVQIVLDAVLSGKEVPVKSSSPYGCSVKYKD